MDQLGTLAQVLVLRAQRGQTAVEYLGVLLLVGAIVGMIASTKLPDRMGRALAREICMIVNDEADCPMTAAERDRRAEKRRLVNLRRDRDHDGVSDRQERRYGTDPRSSDTDGDGIPDATEIRRKTQRDPGPFATAASPVKKIACTIAKGAAKAADAVIGSTFPSDVVKAICGGIKKAENMAERKVLAPIVERLCTRQAGVLPSAKANTCKQAIEVTCTFINKLDKRACAMLKELACFVSELDVFCTGKQKATKRMDALRKVRRSDVSSTFVGGNLRSLGRDALNRAQGTRATVSRATVRHRRVNQREGRARSDDVPGIKPCTQKVTCWPAGSAATATLATSSRSRRSSTKA
jgi:hypothetical protein